MLDVHFRVLRLWISSWGQRGSALPQLGQAKPPASLDGWTLNQQTVSASLDKCLHEPVPLTVLPYTYCPKHRGSHKPAHHSELVSKSISGFCLQIAM